MSPNKQVRDQMGRTLWVPINPQRIISLVPSQTELLADLGIGNRLVGRTKFCIHPARELEKVPIIGGTKNFRFEPLEALQPDLIIGNKEENYPEGINALAEKYPVWMSDIVTLSDSLEMIEAIGSLVGKLPEATALANDIRTKFHSPLPPAGKALYLIWKNPWMAAGPGTFIHEMLTQAGWSNCVAAPRYPEFSEDALRELDPQWVLLSSEPFPFKEKHVAEVKRIFPGARVMCVDGEMFSWYGSRLRHSMAYFRVVRDL
jgi:ABC-type Fe3+-hydroxamate transport system substrate-binding protein